MKLIRQGKISYLQPNWAQEAGVSAGFTTRNGGVSRPPYNSLNLGFNTDDAKHNVEGNRSTLARSFDLPPHCLLTVKQVHGENILVIDEENPDLSHFLQVESDAILTNQSQIMAGVLTADCYPVILYSPEKKAGGVVHVGWRGAAAGLLGKSIKALTAHFGGRPEQLCAAIGPGIGAHHYEVDRPVRDAFRNGVGDWDVITQEVALGKWQLDLKKSCQLQLESAGLDPVKIEAVEEDTCCHRELFFSYRRDGRKTGRQLGFLLLN
ncbi:MAG: peptidoglycan editing factor PgeF [Desulfuromonas sp.]|mgnify:CR=1 FL=1|nr:MAG: peptidoglycan editing factor PgeF [Desulfuromonas sp.]